MVELVDHKKGISPVEAEKRLKKYGWCRGITHFWRQQGGVRYVNKAYQIHLVCPSCGTTRITRILENGRLIKHPHIYKHPEDYSIRGYDYTRADARRILFVEKGGK